MSNRLREERERVSRRWAIVANASVVLLVCAVAAYSAIRHALWDCGHDVFGWGDGYRRCTFAETRAWLQSEAGAGYWVTLAVIVGLTLLGLVGAAIHRKKKK